MRSLSRYLAVAAPIAFALAALFNLGYLYRYDTAAFSYFSLSEHVVFSVEEFPTVFLALFLTVLSFSLVFGSLSFVPKIGYRVRNFFAETSDKPVPAWQFFIIAISAPILSAAILRYQSGVYIAAILVLILSSVIVAGIHVLFKPHVAKIATSVVFLAVLAFVSFDIGRISAEFQFKKHCNPHSLKLKNGNSLEGRFLRAGEKGVLFFENIQKRTHFIKWDEITEVIRERNRC
jgi:hypothetical protein